MQHCRMRPSLTGIRIKGFGATRTWNRILFVGVCMCAVLGSRIGALLQRDEVYKCGKLKPKINPMQP